MNVRMCAAVCVFPILSSLASAAGPSDPPASYELGAGQAAVWREGKLAEVKPLKDVFSPGIDGVAVGPTRPPYSQIEWVVRDIPEGEYFLGLPVIAQGYMTFSESIPRGALFVNGRRLFWTSHSEPVHPATAGDPRRYQAEMRVTEPVRLKAGDTVRLITSFNAVIGPLRCYRERPAGPEISLYVSPFPSVDLQLWLNAEWADAQRSGDTISQSGSFHNPGVVPLALTLHTRATDYLQSVLFETNETVVLAPHERLSRTYVFRRGASGITRLLLTARTNGSDQVLSLPRYYVEDQVAVPRPRLSLNGAWEQCFVPGMSAEPGERPPAGAAWSNAPVPSIQVNQAGHCVWYRRRLTLPAGFRGERYVLKFEQVLSEAWIYVNGQLAHHQFDGADPFEAEITAALKPDGDNEILVAARDWLAYSPKNRERIKRGEDPVFKDGMIAPAGYTAAEKLGIGRPVWLEARPAVAVEDVRLATSVRAKKLTASYRLENRGAKPQTVTVTPRVLDAGAPVLSLPAQTVRIPPGTNVEVSVEAPWKNPRLWQPGAPYLYTLQTDLAPEAGAADRHVERFGFRELWIEGYSFVLNGVRTKIRSNWTGGTSAGGQIWGVSPLGERLEKGAAWQLHAVHNWGVQLARTHNCVGVKEVCEVADETGLMLKIEDGSVCQQAFTFDTNYWHNVIASEVRMVRAYQNHASVFMWSAGNENMWGWIYQGEAAKTLGNKWQVRVVSEMRKADLMARPSEWEADGDLMGKWEYHQLHYPREIGGNPDLPNSAWWGPLDGKTVVPYSMGPITLGEKPITDGEAFWPATLSHPFGQSIVLGDNAYLGSGPMWRGWEVTSQFFVNGFRDVEFALIDTYTSIGMQKPQTVVLKEETAAFFGGRDIVRNVNVHHDLRAPATLKLRWSLTLDGSARPAASGGSRLKMQPAELRRLALTVKLPEVARPTAARFAIELTDGGRLVHTETRTWQLCPAPAPRLPPGLNLAVFDPAGATAATLDSLKVPFTRLETLRAPKGNALLVGRDALRQAPQGPWREELSAFVRGGGKVLLLEQSEALDFLPFPAAYAAKAHSTMAFARAGDHPALAGLTSDDLRWWADDHTVSTGNYRKPATGNVLPLIDIGTMEGMAEMALFEEYLGAGSYLVCQMPLTAKARLAPQAARLLENLLGYLAAPQAFRTGGKTALLAGGNVSLRKALDDSRVVYESLDGRLADLLPSKYALAVADAAAATEPDAAQALRAFAEQGGRVLLHGAAPERQSRLEALLGVSLRFQAVTNEPNEVQNRVFRRGDGGLLAGLANHELFWPSKDYLAELRKEGRWWSDCGRRPPAEWIADYFVLPAAADGAKATALTRPCALLQVPAGRGCFVLSQFRMDQPPVDALITAGRLRSLLLTNLGATIQPAQGTQTARADRLKRYTFNTISLAPYANRGLKDDPQAGLVGWSNQGENDMRALPTGKQRFADVPFLIATPKAAVVLKSRAGLGNNELPERVKIAVGGKADALFFLHDAAYCGGGQKVWQYRVNYADGSGAVIPIHEGQQVLDWWSNPISHAEALAKHGAVVAWQGDNPMRKGVVLISYEWTNPSPEKEIADVVFEAVAESGFGPTPILVGLTTAMIQSDEGIVTDVIGTRGLKVRLGTQVSEVFYTGVGALPDTHAYYGDALAAHKALAVGRKVKIQDDVVTRNAQGQRIAYVFLSEQGLDIKALLNAKMIGDGLAPLGDFEGNNRYRMYMENLGFIASQSKRGMWSAGK